MAIHNAFVLLFMKFTQTSGTMAGSPCPNFALHCELRRGVQLGVWRYYKFGRPRQSVLGVDQKWCLAILSHSAFSGLKHPHVDRLLVLLRRWWDRFFGPNQLGSAGPTGATFQDRYPTSGP